MFLCAVARPHYDPCAKCCWGGKLGIWLIGERGPAKQKSKNRPKGTLVWKNKTVTKEVYRELLITKSIPPITEKWPRWDRLSRKIIIQQAGVKNHIDMDAKVFNDTLREHSINAKLYNQAASSSDMNLLDLGFFRPIQSFNDAMLRNEEELIDAISGVYDSDQLQKVNCTCLTLQSCFNQILHHNGDNKYNVEHLCKEKLEWAGKLPHVLDVVADAK